ncbi:PKD domain-containing protein [Flavobacterium sp. 245]|uniref:PKD domain-containing protein n=1 Tax=Flavobacterium sp. 245 TaxID=2512115 RepID=UPI001061D7A7|nr:gliding motility-associated C-terminal domain-containing protein [Flavobacterium sp. 245]TDP03209.1 putative repeat protein (TIGR01451 family)/gliding motility-associated-like protein [Flavobacterium sp. 245]
MPHFYFYSAFTTFSKKLYLAIILIILSTISLNAQNCTVNAGVLNTTICETDALVLEGNSPSPIIGTVLWTQISGPAVVINTPNSPTTTISGYTGGNTYIFRYSATCGDGILSYQDKVVNVKPITQANAGGNIASCPSNNGTLAIIGNTPQNTGETGYWEIVGANNAGVIINFPNLATSTITLPDTSCGVTTLQWVIEGPEFAPGQRCRTTSQITVTNYGGVKPVSAGPDQTLSNCYTTTQSTDLSATYGGCGLNGQSGQWTFVSGPNTPTIANPNSNNTGISNLTEGTYTFRWTVTGSCASGNDLVVITVPPATQDVTQLSGGDENIFFCDNTINQVTLVAQTPLYAGETVQWSVVSGGPPNAIIASPTNPTTLVTNISEAGSPYRFRYTLTNTNTGCIFTKDYIVQYNGPTRTIVANNGDDIVGSCNATVFTIPLAVTGTGSNQYRIVSGPVLSPLGPFPTALQDTGNSLTLTLTAPGDYTVEFIRKQTGALTVQCDYGFDTINVLVSGEPTPSNAGTDVSLPCGDTATILSGVSTDDGLHFWSQLSGPNIAVIDDNFAVNTQISGLVSGTYVFQYITKGGGATCGFSVSTVNVYVSDSTIDNVNAGQDQVICTNSQVPLAADQPDDGEIGTWSQVSGPNTIMFSNVNDPNAIATGFLTPSSTYELQWTVSYLHPGPSCGSAISDNVIIATSELLAPTPSDAGPDACYSSGTTTFNLSANSTTPIEYGTWTVRPVAGVVIANENDPNTAVTVPGNGTYVFTWTIVARLRTCLPSESSVSVTVAETPPTANAGPDQEICGNTIIMAATQSGGSIGTWSRISGIGNYTVSDLHDPNAVFTFDYSGYYIFRWTVDASICGQAFDDINLTVGIPPKQALAGPDQNICNNSSVTMAGSTYDSFFELGQWSVLTGAPNQPTIVNPSNPNTVINGLIAGTYTFRWTVTAKSIFLCPGSYDDMIVIVDPAADAGPDQTFCDVTSVQLKASENSRGTWTLTSTTGNTSDVVITQSPSDSYLANATVVPGNEYVFTFTTFSYSFPDGSSCAGTSDSVNITIYSGASIDPNAGPDQTLCINDVAGETTMSGNIPPADVDTAEWRFVYQPAGSIAVIETPSAPLTRVLNLTVPGLYILEWVFESNNCRSLSDIVRIEMNAPPSTADAGPDDTVACQTSYKTAAVPPAVGIGTWTITSQPPTSNAVIDNPNSPVTTLSNVILGTYILTWTVTNGPHTSPSLCQPSSDTVTITFNDTPPSIANAGPDQEYCDVDSFNLNAVPVTSGIGTWTQVSGPSSNIGSVNSPTSLIFGISNPGTYEYRWTTTTLNNNGCTSADTVIITIYDTPSTADAGPNQIVPQFTPINLNAVAPTVGTGSWTQTGGPSIIGFTDPTSPTSAVTGTLPGIYTLQWNVTNGNCTVSSDTMNLTILAVADLELTKTVTPTTGSIGDVVTFNINVFNNNNAQGGTVTATNVAIRDYIPSGFIIVPGSVNLAGQYNVGDNTVTWTGLTIPSGNILNLTFQATILSTGSYVNSAEVIASDQFDPDSTPNNGVSTEDDQDSATVILDVADLSLQKTVSPTSVSINDNVIFTIRITNSGPNNATGIRVSDHLPPGYTYVSDNGAGKYNNTTGIWNVGNLNNGNSLALQITAKVNVVAALSNYVNTAEIQTAKQKDPDSTPGNGLPEDDIASANITLKTADLELTKAVTPTSGAAGDQVEFTLTVLNNGLGNATGVSVQDVIPEGFTLIPGSVSNNGLYNVATATITWQNLAISNASTVNLTFRAIVNPLGNYLNIAQITASDLADPDSTPNNDDGDQSEDDEDNAPFTFIGPTADLSLIKRVVTGNTSAVIGSQISFELIITNNGPNTTTGVLVKDLIPSGYEFVNYSSSAGLYENTFGIWNVGSIASGVSESLILDVKVLPTGDYLNTTQVTASDLTDPDSAPNNDDGDQSEDDEANAVITPIQPSADLSLTKTVSNPTPLVGSFVTFQIITTNNGPQDAANVTVTDLLPSGYTFSNFNATSGTYDSSTGIWSLDILKNTESETLQITGIVNPTGDYTNIAEVTSSDITDPDSTPNNGVTTEDDYGSATTTPIPQSSDLSLTKTVSDATPLVGSQVTFEVVVTNSGPQDNTGVQVTDLLPSGYTYAGFTVSTGTYNPTTGLWIVGNLVNGDAETLQIRATVNATGTYLNTAEVAASNLPDPDSTPNNASTAEDDYAEIATTPVLQSADLSLTKTVSNAAPLVGSQVTFSVQLSNAGPQDTNGVTVTDSLPSGYTYVSYTATAGSYNSATGLWTVGSVLNGASHTLQITATVNATGTYLNTVEVTASDLPDPDSTPNNASTTEDDYAEIATTPIPQSADLSITKTVSNAAPVVGSQVTFSVQLSNAGPQDTNGVAVTDLLPSGYTYVSYTATAGSYNSATGLWTVGSVLNGASNTLQITATVNATGTYLNTAEVTASDLPDPDSTPNNASTSEDDYATATITPTSQASDLSLTKTVNNTTPLVGAQVTFEIVVTNNGPQDNTGVQVTDLIPSGYTFSSFTNSTGTYNPATGIWSVGNLPLGQSETLQVIAIINDAGIYTNIAEVTAAALPDPDSTPNNGIDTEDDYASATVTPVRLTFDSDLSLTKTVNNTTPLVGSQVTFEVVVTNNGSLDNTGVEVTDLLPSGYTFNAYTISSGTYNPTTGLWIIGNIINGKSETLQITATVNPTGNYTNSAEVTAADEDDFDSDPNNGPNTEDDYAEASTTPIGLSSDLSLTKTVNNATPLVGSQVTFEVIVTNNGPQDNRGVQITDLLPTGYTYNGSTVSAGSYNPTTGLWTVGNLNNGQSETLHITATVNLTGDYLNIAEVSAANLTDPDSTPNNGVSTEDDYASVATIPITQASNLSLTKTVNNATPLIGSAVTFEVIITNNGPQNTAGVEVTDLLPSGYTFTSYTATKGTYNRTTGKWTIGSLINGDSQTLQITANVNSAGNYSNIAEVTASALPDPNSTPNNGNTTEDDYATASTTPIAPIADLSLTKNVIGGNLSPIFGATITFELTVKNSGPHTATGVRVKDILPSGFEYIVYSSTTGQYSNSTGTWDIGTIPNGASETLMIGVKVNTTGNYNNTAEIFTSNEHDPDSTPNNNVVGEDDQDAQLITPVPALTDLSIEKNVVGNNLTPTVGSQIAFTVTVTNNGPSSSTGVTIKDILPLGYQYVFYNSTSGSYDAATGIWTPGIILSGNSHTLLINALVKNPTGTAGEYLNTAEIMTSDQLDPDSTPGNGVTTEDDYDSISVIPVIVMADLSITKTALNQSATYDVGATVIFTVTVKNDGPANASGVSVKDLLPPGFKYVSSALTGGLYNYITGVWNVGIVTAGNNESLEIYTTVNPPTGAAGEYTNTTEIIASNLPDPDSTPNNGIITEDDYDSLQINVAVADLSLDKSVSNKNANVNEIITFTLQLDNAGPSIATGVNVDDIIPLGYRNIANISNGGIFSNNTIKWANLTVPVGGATLTYQVTVANPKGLDHDDYLNMAQVTASNQFDPDSMPNNDNGDQSEDDEDSEFINIPSTDIAINKEVDKTDVAMYSSVIFTVTADNLGNLTATNVEVKDLLPKGYELETATATAGSYDSATGIWKIPNIAAKGSQTLTLNVKVVDIKDYLNIAQLVSMDQIDTNASNNQDSATVSPNCLKIWNEFSPNDDGQNETFYIDCITQYPDNQLSIFNRWGNLVYFKKGYDNTWDGKEEGSAKTLPEGTYFYILDLGDGSEKTSGWLYLKN